MIINTNNVRLTLVYYGVLYACDFSYFHWPVSIKDSKVYPDTTSDDVLLGLFHTCYKLLHPSSTFIEVVNDRSNRTVRIPIDKCILSPKHPSLLQIINFKSSSRNMIWLYYKILSIKSVILKYSTKCYLVFWIRNLLSSWISWKKNLLPDEVQHEIFNSFFHGFAAIFGPIEPAVANVFECNAVKDD